MFFFLFRCFVFMMKLLNIYCTYRVYIGHYFRNAYLSNVLKQQTRYEYEYDLLTLAWPSWPLGGRKAGVRISVMGCSQYINTIFGFVNRHSHISVHNISEDDDRCISELPFLCNIVCQFFSYFPWNSIILYGVSHCLTVKYREILAWYHQQPNQTWSPRQWVLSGNCLRAKGNPGFVLCARRDFQAACSGRSGDRTWANKVVTWYYGDFGAFGNIQVSQGSPVVVCSRDLKALPVTTVVALLRFGWMRMALQLPAIPFKSLKSI